MIGTHVQTKEHIPIPRITFSSPAMICFADEKDDFKIFPIPGYEVGVIILLYFKISIDRDKYIAMIADGATWVH